MRTGHVQPGPAASFPVQALGTNHPFAYVARMARRHLRLTIPSDALADDCGRELRVTVRGVDYRLVGPAASVWRRAASGELIDITDRAAASTVDELLDAGLLRTRSLLARSA